MMDVYSDIGIKKSEVDTPALLLDIDTVESNLSKMATFFRDKAPRLRPHVKTHKATSELSELQMQSGAVGLTCAKLTEAEALVEIGINDILIANQIVGPKKVRRLMELARRANIMVAIDSPYHVHELSNASLENDAMLGVLIEVNIGHNRCGVLPFEPVRDLAQQVIDAPGLSFKGLMGYDGHCTTRVTPAERAALSLQANRLLVETKDYIEDAGIPVEIVSASGSFTYRYATQIEGITEIQAGSYLLMDTAFKGFGIEEFDCALTVLATVISRPDTVSAQDHIIIDVGRKSLNDHYGLPIVKFPAHLEVVSLSQEHGKLKIETLEQKIGVGDKVELWISDANGTISNFDRFYVIRNDTVEAVWRIPGCGQST